MWSGGSVLFGLSRMKSIVLNRVANDYVQAPGM